MLNSREGATASLEGTVWGQEDMKRRVGATEGSSTLESSSMHGEVRYNKRTVKREDNGTMLVLIDYEVGMAFEAWEPALPSCSLSVSYVWDNVTNHLPAPATVPPYVPGPYVPHQKGLYSPEL